MKRKLWFFALGLIFITGCGEKAEINPKNFDSRTLTCAAYFVIVLDGMQNGSLGKSDLIKVFKIDLDEYLYLVMRKERIIEKDMSDELREKNAKLFNKLTFPEGERLTTIYNTAREQMPTDQCRNYLKELQGIKTPTSEPTSVAVATPSVATAPVADVTPAVTAASPATTTPTPTLTATATATVSEDLSPFTPSFDCSKASNGQEKMVCADRDLSKLDVNLSQAYSRAKEKSTDKDKLKKEQLDWIKFSLRACSDKNCLMSTYQKRIVELQ